MINSDGSNFDILDLNGYLSNDLYSLSNILNDFLLVLAISWGGGEAGTAFSGGLGYEAPSGAGGLGYEVPSVEGTAFSPHKNDVTL